MNKQLPTLQNDPTVQQYMEMMLKSDKKKEYKDTEELLQYISGMEKQFEEVIKELHDVKELLNGLQNPSAKVRLSDAVNQVHLSVDKGKKKFAELKNDLIFSMKECLLSFRQKGKEGVVKTINVLHFKEALREIHKSFFIGMNKTNYLVQTCDTITSEMRNAKRNLKNVALLMIGKTVQNDKRDINKINLMQKCSRSMHSSLKMMTIKTAHLLHRVEDFEKPSVKTEIRLLKNTTESKNTKIHEKKEQSR